MWSREPGGVGARTTGTGVVAGRTRRGLAARGVVVVTRRTRSVFLALTGPASWAAGAAVGVMVTSSRTVALTAAPNHFRLGRDLELGVAVEDPDRADVLLGDVAQAADQRDQPLGVGVVAAAGVEAEPGRVGHVGARFALGTAAKAAVAVAEVAISEALAAVVGALAPRRAGLESAPWRGSS